jgi:hypothetical protein
MAAIATEPVWIDTFSPATDSSTGRYCRRSTGGASATIGGAGSSWARSEPTAASDGASDAGKDSADAVVTASPRTGFSASAGDSSPSG